MHLKRQRSLLISNDPLSNLTFKCTHREGFILVQNTARKFLHFGIKNRRFIWKTFNIRGVNRSLLLLFWKFTWRTMKFGDVLYSGKVVNFKYILKFWNKYISVGPCFRHEFLPCNGPWYFPYLEIYLRRFYL